MEETDYSEFSILVLVLITPTIFVGHSPAVQDAPRDTLEEEIEVLERNHSNQPRITPEQRVLTRIRQINEIGIEAAQTARQAGSSQWVQNYGAQLVRDHQLVYRRIRRIASRENIELIPDGLNTNEPREQLETPLQLMEQFTAADGEEFDKLFLKMMVMLHRHSIDLLTEAAENVDNQAVRQFIEMLIPILDQHRRLARHIQAGEVV